ncbi:MAG: hypothetical protein JO340_19455 [Acidobacteriaceae bacterium]|nr:hypothetical protein [Acidobacteriaceae bacterium]
MGIAGLCLLPSPMFSQSCSNASLQGGYGFSFHGTNLEMKLDFIMVGAFEADGKGAFKGTESQSVSGKVSRGPFTGSYTVQPDCTGSAVLKFEGSNFDAKLDFALVADGDELLILDVGGGNLESGEAKREFRKGRK